MKTRFTKSFWLVLSLVLGSVSIPLQATITGNTILCDAAGACTFTGAGVKLNPGTSSEVTITSNKASDTSQGSGCGTESGATRPMNGVSTNGDYIEFKATGGTGAALDAVDIIIAANSSGNGNANYHYQEI